MQQIPVYGAIEVFKHSLATSPSVTDDHFSEVSWEVIDREKHLAMIYEWVQLPYAKKFWQMDHLSLEELTEHYENILKSPNSTSLIGYFEGHAVCQVELYKCLDDEISHHYAAKTGDIGLHFLMAPLKESKKTGLSFIMMLSILSILFNYDSIERVIGEPDIRNEKANRLVRKAGFVFLSEIQMSYKQANLYECTRATFSI